MLCAYALRAGPRVQGMKVLSFWLQKSGCPFFSRVSSRSRTRAGRPQSGAAAVGRRSRRQHFANAERVVAGALDAHARGTIGIALACATHAAVEVPVGRVR